MKNAENSSNFDDFPPIGGVIASKKVLEDNAQPGFMFREKPNEEGLSGWVIFQGKEPQEYCDDAANFGIYDPRTILEIDSSVYEILLKGIGSVYEKNEQEQWCKITDYPLEDDYMVKHQLTHLWQLEINNLFIRRNEEEGSILYTTGDKSVRLSIWSTKNKSKKELYLSKKKDIETRDQIEAKTLEIFDFSDEEVLRVGYLTKERSGEKEYYLICGFSIIDNEQIIGFYYFDNEEDMPWAIETWKNLKIIKQ